MKRFSLFFTLLISLLFLSCSNSLQGRLTVSDSESANCTILVQSKNNIISFSKNTNRTILPSTIDSSTLHFYLWGTNKITGESVTITEVEFSPTEDSTTGTVDFNFANSTSYELYLGATKTAVTIEGVYNSTAIENVKKELCYIGFATADLRYATQVLFYLSPYAVTTGYGTASLKLYTTWDIPSGYTVTAGLYNRNTDAEIVMHKTTSSGVINPSSVDYTYGNSLSSSNTEPESANYIADYLTPGIYNFKVIFTGTKTFVYSDTIVILANQTTEATIAVPNILEYKPTAAPSALTVAYSDPSSYSEDFYPVEFTWKDNSTNETYFQLDVMDISDVKVNDTNNGYISTVTDTTGAYTLEEKNSAWNLLNGTTYHFNPDYYGDSSVDAFIDVCTAGALCCNNNYIVVKLMLGNRYLARISAVNYMGSSDYAYTDVCNTGSYTIPTPKKDGTALSETFSTFSQNTDCINRYRIHYYLNNGRFKTSTGTDVTASVKTYSFASHNTSSSVTLMNPVNYAYDSSDSSKTATLSYHETNPEKWTTWTKWTKNQVKGDNQDSTYSGFENLNLFAYYDGTNTTNGSGITQSTVNSYFAVFGSKSETYSESSVKQLTITNDYFTINPKTYKYLYLLVANPQTSGTYTYSSVSLVASDKYGITSEYTSNVRETVTTGFTQCNCFVLDISDTTKYEANDTLYYVEFHLTPSSGASDEITYTLKYKLE